MKKNNEKKEQQKSETVGGVESKKSQQENLVDLEKVSHAENYLRENLKNHSIADLKSALLAGNYKEEEINEAIRRMQGGTFVDSPFEISKLFGQTWSLFSKNIKKLSLISLIANLPLIAFLFLNNEKINKLSEPNVSSEEAFGILESFANPVEIAFIAISAIFLIIGMVTLYKTIVDVDKGEDLSISDHFSASYKYVLPMIWIQILMTIIVLFGFILLIIPGIIFAVWYTFTEFALLLEDKRGLRALKSSHDLVRGRWWSVFGRIVLVVALVSTISFFIGFTAFIPYIGNSLSQALSIFGTIFIIIFTMYMYKALMEIKDN